VGGDGAGLFVVWGEREEGVRVGPGGREGGREGGLKTQERGHTLISFPSFISPCHTHVGARMKRVEPASPPPSSYSSHLPCFCL